VTQRQPLDPHTWASHVHHDLQQLRAAVLSTSATAKPGPCPGCDVDPTDVP